MTTKYIILFACIFTISCTSKKKEVSEDPMYNEPALKSFITSTPAISETIALNMLDSIFNKANEDSAVFLKTVSYFETPLGDPNSSYKNENLYSNLLQAKIKSVWIDSATKANTREKLYLLMQNRPGSLANDFTYTTAAGYKKKMYDVKADYVLLYFNNPGCDACKQMKAALVASSIINEKIKAEELKILSIHTDNDIKLWLDHLSEYPESWLQGRDEDEYLYKNKVYDLRAIPTVYLLDREKKVVLKDCVSISLIEQMLTQSDKLYK